MTWIEQNLDAYRVIAEILNDLRPLVRERLEERHGKEWFRDGIPEPVFERLIANKEQEASIDWYENRYQEVISYAVFPDLFEIIIANPGLFDPILKLAPSQSLLNTRFLELEVMRSKVGRARPVSEAEINFLTSFHLRFRRAVQELSGAEVGPAPTTDAHDFDGAAAAETAAATPTGGGDAAGAAAVQPTPAGDAHESSIEQAQPKPSREARSPSDRPPQRLAPSPAADDGAAAAEPETPEQPPSEAPSDEREPEAEPAKRETPSAIVKRGLEAGDDLAVLRELYREVTGIAEVIWTTSEMPTTSIWDRVSTHPWYEANFSRLELRPLSDFYELISQVKAKRDGGAAKSEIQSFLNDSKFATILLGLRDMFQRNGI